MRIAAIQLTPSTDPAANIAQMRERAAEAAAQGAQVVVFPEQTMLLLQSVTAESLVAAADEWWDAFARATAEIAVAHEITVVSAGFEPSGADLPFNTMLAIGPDGSELARYRKLHLYVAFAASEAEHTRAGEELPPVFEVAHAGERLRVGLANCYDVRFPELFRSLSERGAQVTLLAAAWASGPGKEDHWDMLTRTRALENVQWVVACGAVGGGSRNTATTGLSRIVDPLGGVVAGLGPREPGIVVADVTAAAVEQARTALPALENRRIALTYDVR